MRLAAARPTSCRENTHLASAEIVKVQRLKRNVVVLGSSYEEPFGLPPPLKRYCLNSHVAGHRVIR